MTFLQAIAKAIDNSEKDTAAGKIAVIGSGGGMNGVGGWDTDVVEDMWRAVLGYVIEIGGLVGDLVGLKEIVDRMSDKASVLPPPFFSSPSPLS
jgi:hypothetical protein